jgi:outer membrane receptor protein involved in Fe transport
MRQWSRRIVTSRRPEFQNSPRACGEQHISQSIVAIDCEIVLYILRRSEEANIFYVRGLTPMNSNQDKLRLSIRMILAAASIAIASAPAHAETATTPAAAAAAAPATPAASGADDTLEIIVVTASAGDRSKLDTSTSISSVNAEQIKDFDATSTAELYRMIPGIQVAGTQGDGGNSNIGVRGLRTPTGGSPFVQIQEDGLPVVLFGDIQFGNNDYWTHPMPTDERIEAIRGGTASTLASQAIGAVLNHISFTGRNEGGYVELEKGANYDFTKVNFRFGSSVNDTTYYNLGGYYDVGRGIEHAAYNVSNSYAIKGNITKELADDKGYIRVLFKAANTQEPSYNGCISSATLNGKTVSGLGASPYCDARNQAPGYSALNSSALFSNASGVIGRQPLNGILTDEKWLQLQTHYNYGGGLVIDDNARVARMSGAFDVQFYNAVPTAGVLGTGQSLIYANGSNAGQPFTGAYVNNNSQVHTNMNHMDHIANDLSVTYSGDLSPAHFDLKAGYLYYSQRIAEDWHSNNNVQDAIGSNPAELDLVSGLNGSGNLLAAGGTSGFNQGWNQQFDLTFTDNAPYADLNVDLGNLNLDGSVREEFFQGSGWAQGSSGNPLGYVAPTVVGTVTTNPGVPLGNEASVVQTDPRTGKQVTTLIPILGYDGPLNAVDFQEHATNWSFGALYKLTPDLSAFARASHGTRFNADRTTNAGYFNPNGSLNAAGQANSAFPVDQYELGLKNRGDLFGGHYTVELTSFYSTYKISSQEISITNCLAILGINEQTCIISGKYQDAGIELFSTYRVNGFNILFSGTYDDSKVSAHQGASYLRSPNIPNFTYTGLFSYDIMSAAEVGISLDGQSTITGGDGNTYPSSLIVGAFAKVEPIKNLQLGLNVYNLTNSYASPSAANFVSGSTTLINASPAQGVAVKVSARLKF